MDFRSVRVLGAILRERRLALGLSQAELGLRSGVSREFVLRLEGGKRRSDLGLTLAVVEALGGVLSFAPEKTETHE